jgi:hypothetical protein
VARIEFPGDIWSEIEALPASARRAVHRVLAHLVEESVPSLADPFPADSDPLPGAYKLYLPADGVTIWYVVGRDERSDVISIQHVRVDP